MSGPFQHMMLQENGGGVPSLLDPLRRPYEQRGSRSRTQSFRESYDSIPSIPHVTSSPSTLPAGNLRSPTAVTHGIPRTASVGTQSNTRKRILHGQQHHQHQPIPQHYPYDEDALRNRDESHQDATSRSVSWKEAQTRGTFQNRKSLSTGREGLLQRQRSDTGRQQRSRSVNTREQTRSRSRSSHDGPTTKGLPSMEKTKAYAKEMADGWNLNPERIVREAVHTGFTVGRQMTSCAMLTADIYRQECATSQSRGGDRSPSSVNNKQKCQDYNFLDDEDDDDDDDDIRRKPPRRQDPVGRRRTEREPLSSDEELEPPTLVNTAREGRMGRDAPPTRDGIDDDGASYQSRKGIRFPEAFDIMNTSASKEYPSPQRNVFHRPRGTYDIQEEKKEDIVLPYDTLMMKRQEPGRQFTTEFTNLSQLRQHLFQKASDVSEANSVDEKYNRALEDLSAQDTAIHILNKELQATKEALEQAQRELQDSRDMAARKQQMTTEYSTKLFRERIDVEERLRDELRLNLELRKRITEMEQRAENLASELDRFKGSIAGSYELLRAPSAINSPTKVESGGETISLLKEGRSPITEHRSSFNERERDKFLDEGSVNITSDIVALRSEVVELRAQLAEARAARLSAQEERNRIESDRRKVHEEAQGLKEEVEKLKRECANLLSNKPDSRNHDSEICRLEEEVAAMELRLLQTKQEVSAQTMRSHELEEKLIVTQVETLELKSQVAELKKELEQTKHTAEERIKAADLESKELLGELQEMKDRLTATNYEIIRQASDHLREKQQLEGELMQAIQVAQRMQIRIEELDSIMADKETIEVTKQAHTHGPEARNFRTMSMDVLSLLKNMRETTAK